MLCRGGEEEGWHIPLRKFQEWGIHWMDKWRYTMERWGWYVWRHFIVLTRHYLSRMKREQQTINRPWIIILCILSVFSHCSQYTKRNLTLLPASCVPLIRFLTDISACRCEVVLATSVHPMDYHVSLSNQNACILSGTSSVMNKCLCAIFLETTELCVSSNQLS